MIRPLLHLLAAELTAAWTGEPSPTRRAAKRWLRDHGIDVLVGVSEWLVPEPMTGPGVVSATPREQCETGRMASLGGVVFRRPCCAVCREPVDVTLSGDADSTGEVVFTCHQCEACEVVTFAGLMPDAEVAGFLAVVRPFEGGEPS